MYVFYFQIENIFPNHDQFSFESMENILGIGEDFFLEYLHTDGDSHVGNTPEQLTNLGLGHYPATPPLSPQLTGTGLDHYPATPPLSPQLTGPGLDHYPATPPLSSQLTGPGLDHYPATPPQSPQGLVHKHSLKWGKEKRRRHCHNVSKYQQEFTILFSCHL